jgi:hypothetical protein
MRNSCHFENMQHATFRSEHYGRLTTYFRQVSLSLCSVKYGTYYGAVICVNKLTRFIRVYCTRYGKYITGVISWPAFERWLVLQHVRILSHIQGGCGSVTNETTKVRIGYRIYWLWRLQLQMVTITETTIALAASWIEVTELHCADVSLRGLN